MGKSGGSSKKQAEAPRANRARAVADIVPDVGRAAFRRFGFVQSSIVSRWREIVGERYAAVSSPESIRFPAGKRAEGVLNLIVEGAHAPMMQHVAPVVVERVNRFFGYQAVARVSFRQGLVQNARARTRAAPPSLRPIPAELGDSLREVADPELRACLESLARGVAANEAALGPAVAIPVLGRIGGETKR
ncbi:MAG TPA: DciA family protein [Allosphingosinicella sp.]